tara:strand:- start:156 stop:512 length:357 start_codon:yes stop_codon:yes gene_type:complete
MKQSSIVALDAALKKTGVHFPTDLNDDKYTIEEFSEMSRCWYEHVKDTFDELVNLKVPNEPYWMIKVENAGYASNLIWDLVEMTRWIPYKNKEIDMKNIAYNSLIVCPDNHILAKFFK